MENFRFLNNRSRKFLAGSDRNLRKKRDYRKAYECLTIPSSFMTNFRLSFNKRQWISLWLSVDECDGRILFNGGENWVVNRKTDRRKTWSVIKLIGLKMMTFNRQTHTEKQLPNHKFFLAANKAEMTQPASGKRWRATLKQRSVTITIDTFPNRNLINLRRKRQTEILISFSKAFAG